MAGDTMKFLSCSFAISMVTGLLTRLENDARVVRAPSRSLMFVSMFWQIYYSTFLSSE